MSSFVLSTLERKKEDIIRISIDLSFLYISDIKLRSSFINGETELATNYINEFKLGHLSFGEATSKLHEQYKILEERHFDLMANNAKLFALIKKEKDRNSVTNIVLAQVGFVSGGLQVIGGYGICEVSLGAACASLGGPLMAHGAENLWENAHYLVMREETAITPLKDAYIYAAEKLGQSEDSGKIAYSIGDITLSMGGGFRNALKPDAWKLFRYIKDDYIIGWKTMGTAGVTSEIVGDSASGYSIHKIVNEKSSKWDDLTNW